MAIKKSSKGIRKWKNNKAEAMEQESKCLMAKVRSQSVCEDSLCKDLLLDHEKLLKDFKSLGKLNPIILANSKDCEQENSELKEENNFLVK